MQKHSDPIDVGIGVKMIDARGVKRAGSANDPVHLIAFLQKEIGQIAPILSGDPGD